jgi:hypothetical protein
MGAGEGKRMTADERRRSVAREKHLLIADKDRSVERSRFASGLRAIGAVSRQTAATTGSIS